MTLEPLCDSHEDYLTQMMNVSLIFGQAAQQMGVSVEELREGIQCCVLEAAQTNLCSPDPALRAKWERMFREINSFEAEELFIWLMRELENNPERMN